MSFSDFYENFNSFCVCSYRMDWKRITAEGTFERSTDKIITPSFRVKYSESENNSGALAWISLNQNDSRFIGSKPYIDIGAIILSEDGEIIESEGYIGFQFVRCTQKHFNLPIKPGKTFTIVPYSSGQHLMENDDELRSFSLAIHSHSVNVSPEIIKLDFDSSRLQSAFELTLEKFSPMPANHDPLYIIRSIPLESILVYGLQTTEFFAKEGKSVSFTVDTSKSENLTPTLDS